MGYDHKRQRLLQVEECHESTQIKEVVDKGIPTPKSCLKPSVEETSCVVFTFLLFVKVDQLGTQTTKNETSINEQKN